MSGPDLGTRVFKVTVPCPVLLMFFKKETGKNQLNT